MQQVPKIGVLIINAYPKDDKRGKEEVNRLLSVVQSFGSTEKDNLVKVLNVSDFNCDKYTYTSSKDGRRKYGSFKLGRSVIYNVLCSFLYFEEWFSIRHHDILDGTRLSFLRSSFWVDRMCDFCFIFLIGKAIPGYIDQNGGKYKFVSNNSFSISSEPEEMLARCIPLIPGSSILPTVRRYESPIIAKKIKVEGDVIFDNNDFVHGWNARSIPYYAKLQSPISYSIPIYDYDIYGREVVKVGEKTIECTHRLYIPDGTNDFKTYDCYYHGFDEKENKYFFHYIRPVNYPREAMHVMPGSKSGFQNELKFSDFRFVYLDGTEDIYPEDDEWFNFFGEDTESFLTRKIALSTGFSSLDLGNILCNHPIINLRFAKNPYLRKIMPPAFFFIDCNYSGEFIEQVQRDIGALNIKTVSLLPNYVRNHMYRAFKIFASSSPYQLSWTSPKDCNVGLFTQSFVEGLSCMPRARYRLIETHTRFDCEHWSSEHRKSPQYPCYFTWDPDDIYETTNRFPYNGKV